MISGVGEGVGCAVWDGSVGAAPQPVKVRASVRPRVSKHIRFMMFSPPYLIFELDVPGAGEQHFTAPLHKDCDWAVLQHRNFVTH